MNGRDPVLETAQSIIIPASKVRHIPVDVLKKYTGRYLLNPVQVMDVKLKDTS